MATATVWQTQIQRVLRDEAGVDVDIADITAIGIGPALAQYATDRPRSLAVDKTPAADALEVDLPTSGEGWAADFSVVTRVDAPSGETPPSVMTGCSVDPSAGDPSVEILLMPRSVASGESVRIHFTATYPEPTTTATDDKVPDSAFYAVTALASAYILEALAAERGRQRAGAYPTDFVADTDRSRDLYDVAARLRIQYNTHLGIGASPAGSRRVGSVRVK